MRIRSAFRLLTRPTPIWSLYGPNIRRRHVGATTPPPFLDLRLRLLLRDQALQGPLIVSLTVDQNFGHSSRRGSACRSSLGLRLGLGLGKGHRKARRIKGSTARRRCYREDAQKCGRAPGHSVGRSPQGSCKSYALVGLDFGGLVTCLDPRPRLKRTTALWHTQLGGGAGFEPAKAEPSRLQRDPFDRSEPRPGASTIATVTSRFTAAVAVPARPRTLRTLDPRE